MVDVTRILVTTEVLRAPSFEQEARTLQNVCIHHNIRCKIRGMNMSLKIKCAKSEKCKFREL